MNRRSIPSVLCALALMPLLTACPPPCETPTIARTRFSVTAGQTLALSAGDVFNGVCGPDCVTSFRIADGSNPSFLDPESDGRTIWLSARGGDIASSLEGGARLQDSVSVVVDTKCGTATANLTIDIRGRSPRFVRTPDGPQVLPSGAVVLSGPAPAGGSPVVFAPAETDGHF